MLVEPVNKLRGGSGGAVRKIDGDVDKLTFQPIGRPAPGDNKLMSVLLTAS